MGYCVEIQRMQSKDEVRKRFALYGFADNSVIKNLLRFRSGVQIVELLELLNIAADNVDCVAIRTKFMLRKLEIRFSKKHVDKIASLLQTRFAEFFRVCRKFFGK